MESRWWGYLKSWQWLHVSPPQPILFDKQKYILFSSFLRLLCLAPVPLILLGLYSAYFLRRSVCCRDHSSGWHSGQTGVRPISTKTVVPHGSCSIRRCLSPTFPLSTHSALIVLSSVICPMGYHARAAVQYVST
jgi:hypothetical protein